MRTRVSVCITFVLLLFTGLPRLHAQNFAISSCNADDSGSNSSVLSWIFGHQERVCEIRRAALPVVNHEVSVLDDNGAIEVIGENRNDIFLEARIVTQASTRKDADDIQRQVHILTVGEIHADGPHSSGWLNRGWSVSYRLRVPHRIAARLKTNNGGVTVGEIEGAITAETTNGGLTLDDLAGDVHATTTNGGVHVQLAGDRWQGRGMAAESTNGGVHVEMPQGYSAHLIAQTTNGGVSVDFPVTVRSNRHNHLETDIGGGGPTLQFETTNGGIQIGRNEGGRRAGSQDREE